MYARIMTFGLLLMMTVPAFAMPEIQHWETDKGAAVYFVEAHELPMVDIQIIFDAGSARDGDKPGLALLTNALLAEGAGGLSADQISQNFENLGAVFANEANADSSTIGLRSLTEETKLGPALINLRRVITQPDFPATAIERERNRTLVGLRQKQQSPRDLASDAFLAAIYGDHPYAHPQEGTEDSVMSISAGDIAAFHRQYYVASNAVIAIVGDLDRARAERLANELTAELPRGEKAPPLPEVRPLESARSVHIEHPSTQTHVLVGQPGIARTDPDLFPLYVGNHILGGSGMVSRIFEEVREKRGLSYSAYSYFMPMRQAGPFMAGLQTRMDQTEEALAVLHEQLRLYVENGPDKEELESSIQSITGGFPLRIDSNRDIIAYLGMIGFYGLPLDYLETYNEKVMNVTIERIRDAFRRKLSPDKLVTVTVGPESE